MKYTALITRFYQMAEEQLEAIIDEIPDFQEFKEKVLSVFQIADYRGNLQARRLFEDTTLTNELNYSDLQKIRKSIDILFPQVGLPQKLDLNSPQGWNEDERKGKGGFSFTKSLKDGEILKVVLHNIEPEEDINLAIRDIYALIDSRLDRTNKRETDFVKYIRKLDMETQLKIQMILDLLYKRTEVHQVVERLKGYNAQETVDQIREDIVQDQQHAE